MTQSKIRVAVLYGGRSGEHEVSLRSAASVIRNLDPDRYEILPIAIDKQGRWLLTDAPSGASAPVDPDSPRVIMLPYPCAGPTAEGNYLGIYDEKRAIAALPQTESFRQIDVVFPVMHGTFCEDGTIQGLFELADVPYVGCGVLASAVGMDKEVAKRLVRDAGIAIVPFVSVRKEGWKSKATQIAAKVQAELGYPCFVKPSNSGSSVGVNKVKDPSGLQAALEDSFQYDTKVLIEKAVDAREIEFAVLENARDAETPLLSVAGEIIPHHEFYSYEAKYIDDNGAGLKIPAELSADQAARAKDMASRAFVALECEGLARVDLFLDRKTGDLYFNEVNTLPGFTQISMYPKLWEASGLSYRDLLTKLIELARVRHERRGALSREFVSST